MEYNLSLVYINGYFLKANKYSGVYRFSYNILLELDAQLVNINTKLQIILLVPTGNYLLPELRNIMVYKLGGVSYQHIWEQVIIPKFVKGNLLINLANFAPIFKSNQICVIHDALVFTFPHEYKRRFVILARLFHKFITRNSKYIATVSKFSAREIAKYTKKILPEIIILGNSAENFRHINSNENILTKYNLICKNYLLVIFSQSNSEYKNVARMIDIVDQLDLNLVCVGNINFKYHMSNKITHIANVDDSQLKALYENARLLILPSLYEGFGIPLLEAMECSCPIVASDIPVFREICGDAVTYFNPYDSIDMVNVINTSINSIAINEQVKKYLTIRQNYTWSLYAKIILQMVINLINGQ